MGGRINSHKELVVYQRARDLAHRVFLMSKRFPKEETYSLTDQVRRSSRSVAANIAEGWRKRRYEASFVNRLNVAEGEAAETQSWIEQAGLCGYWTVEECDALHEEYEGILRTLVGMIHNSASWILTPPPLHPVTPPSS